jgi:serine/threonine protein kinase
MADFAPNQDFGPYRLLRLLGQGGFAEVWLARESGPIGFQKLLALKVLKPIETADESALHTLMNEARMGGYLQHPHLVDVYRVGEHEGRWYVAMEFVDGMTLGEVIRRARSFGVALPRSIILDVGIAVARALQHAHTARDADGQALNIVHRDLKPPNVMISRTGEVKVADFGIAKAVTNLSTTTTGSLKGTPLYMAPEVWRGERDLQPRVDLFALGVMLWEMTMGRHLFQGDHVAAMAGQALYGLADVEAAALDRRFAELRPVVRRLLERDPEQRLQTAREVVDALRDLRRQVESPGDLELFVGLLESRTGAGSAGGSGAEAAPHDADESHATRRHEISPLETSDPDWSRLVGIASGTLTPESAQETLELGLSVPIGVPGGGPAPPSLVFADTVDGSGGAAAGSALAESRPVAGTLSLQLPRSALPPPPPAVAAAPPGAASGAPAPAAPPPLAASAPVPLSARPLAAGLRRWLGGAAGIAFLTLWAFVFARLMKNEADEREELGEATLGTPPLEPAREPRADAAPAVSPPGWPAAAESESQPRAGDLAQSKSKSSEKSTSSDTSEIRGVHRGTTKLGHEASGTTADSAPSSGPAPVPAATPSPAASAESPPAAVPEDACVLLHSRPPGARVWIDGQPTKLVGRLESSRDRPLQTGQKRLRIEMGHEESRTAPLLVEPVPGKTVAVTCDVSVSMRCTVTELSQPCGTGPASTP